MTSEVVKVEDLKPGDKILADKKSLTVSHLLKNPRFIRVYYQEGSFTQTYPGRTVWRVS